MYEIVSDIFDNLKEEFLNLLATLPSVDKIERFALNEVFQKICQATQAYAEWMDLQLWEDKSGRRREGLAVERRNDSRTLVTRFGEVTYNRTYYAKKDGTFCYPIDEILNVPSYRRVSDSVALGLTEEAKSKSYKASSKAVTNENVSVQTVMNSIRRCRAARVEIKEKRHVPILHVDADEDHVSLQNGRSAIVPLVTVYEGLETVGLGNSGRRKCVNAFNHSESRIHKDFWDNVYCDITSRYDIEGTKIYLHGDGAAWIREGMGYLPNCTFVLDCYHRNKAVKTAFSGCKKGEATAEKRLLASALKNGKAEFLAKVWERRLEQNPDRKDTIDQAFRYLYDNLDAIAVRYKDPEAKNGGATEPHVSHVLSSRLSSRPMGWSMETLKTFVPILASERFELAPAHRSKAPESLVEAAVKALESQRVENCRHVPKAISCRQGAFEALTQGKVTQLYRALKNIAG